MVPVTSTLVPPKSICNVCVPSEFLIPYKSPNPFILPTTLLSSLNSLVLKFFAYNVDFNSYDSALDKTDYLGLAFEPVGVLEGVLVEVLGVSVVGLEVLIIFGSGFKNSLALYHNPLDCSKQFQF